MTNKEIGTRIAVALKLNRMRQKDLAKELGVPDSTVSYWCSGGRVPDVHRLSEIARRLNVSTDYLLGLTTTDNENLLLAMQRRLEAWEKWAAAMPPKKRRTQNDDI